MRKGTERKKESIRGRETKYGVEYKRIVGSSIQLGVSEPATERVGLKLCEKKRRVYRGEKYKRDVNSE